LLANLTTHSFPSSIAGNRSFHSSQDIKSTSIVMLTTLLALVSLVTGTAIPQSSSFGVEFGNFFSTGPVADPAWIQEAITTLVLPELNKPHVGNMALWPGMGTSGGDLIQGLAISTVGVG
jgi:hypothetical protein